MRISFTSMKNCGKLPLASIPCPCFASLKTAMIEALHSGARISSMFAVPSSDTTDSFKLFVILAHDKGQELLVSSAVIGKSYPSLSNDIPQVQAFEREIAEQYGILPEGHPWLKPLRYHKTFNNTPDMFVPKGEAVQPGVTDYYKLGGKTVHEVAVGPVHAGVIEPGHFRFQCHGENVYNLEISLGYQHRGIEKHLIGGPDKKTMHFMETAAGDTTIGHTTAYCQIMESLTGVEVPERAQALRGILLELERLANHTGDLGALANDIAFLPTSSYCGRIRGDYLNMTALFCGNRFGRRFVIPGGVNYDMDALRAAKFGKWLEKTYDDTTDALDLMWITTSALDRLENTGTVSKETCVKLGMVGVPARACGMNLDTRKYHPYGIYASKRPPVAVAATDDVFARADVRYKEIKNSYQFINTVLTSIVEGPVSVPVPEKLQPETLSVSLVEGWRGEICHAAVTDASGKFARYKIVDPSFHNWPGLAMSLREEQISNFPICNKSFNLSYCGHDL